MRVIRAKVLGACMGVRRAVDIVESILREERPVYTLGPLIHNSAAVADFARRGALALDEAALSAAPNLEGFPVVIRAHGVRPDLEETLKGRKARVVDATCPRVKSSQLLARGLEAARFRVFLAGEARHAEILGIQGYAPSCLVVEDAAGAERAGGGLGAGGGKAALLAQTTFSAPRFESVACALRKRFPALEVHNTICGATKARQDALRELCPQVEACVIAGDPCSANTRALAALAREAGKPAYLVETSLALPADLLSCRTVGLSAGASTPAPVIDAIERALLAAGR